MHLLILLVALADPAMAADRSTEGTLAPLLAGRVPGTPVACITVPDINETRVVGDAVVYRIGDTLWVNQPAKGAAQLRGDDLLAARTPTARLCGSDLLYRINRNSGAPLGYVTLGDFTPYRRPTKR